MTQEPKLFPYITRLLQGASVEWKPLGEVAELKRGRVISKEYLYENAGEYPVYSSQTVNNGEIGKIKTFDFDQEAITWTTDGANAGTVFYREGRFSITNVCGLIKIRETEILNYKFLYYWLSIEAKKYVYSGMGNPKLMSNQIAKIPIPLPPISVQREIVRILDKFTTLETELETELEARKRQYEYYRDNLLTFGYEVEWKALGEVGTFVRGNGLQKKDFVETGVGCIHYGQIYTYYGIKASKTISYVTEEFAKILRKASYNDLVIAAVSENIEDVCKCVVWEGEEDICVSGDTFVFKTEQNPHYIGHLLRTNSFLNYKRKNAVGAKVTRLQAGSLPRYIIPLPSLEEQARIADILDRFDTLVNSISEGLPREIELRRKQYEYYRDQLLSFPKT
jgi:Restriction endonuclease S subunits